MKTTAVILSFGVSLWCFLPAAADDLTAAQKKSTVAWIQARQKENGGFCSDGRADAPASLPATAAALRALKSFQGQPKDWAACEKFIVSCHDIQISGFAAVPGKTGDQRATCFGLIAVAQTKLPREKYVMPAVIFLCSSVKKVEDFHWAAAAYEAVQSKCELSSDWIELIRQRQNPDGTYGKGKKMPAETATAVLTVLRLGGRVEKADSVIQALKAAQLDDGGWGVADAKSDLETTYRVVLTLSMLKDRPEAAACRRFVDSCRNQDGSYGIRPGQPGTVYATAFAGAVLQRLETK